MTNVKELDITVSREHNHLNIPIIYIIAKNEETEAKLVRIIDTIRNAVVTEKEEQYEIVPFYPRKANKLDKSNLYLKNYDKTIYLNGKKMENICQRCSQAFKCIDKNIEPFTEDCKYDVTGSKLYQEMREAYNAGEDIEYMEEIKLEHPDWTEVQCYEEMDKQAFETIKKRLNENSEHRFTDEEIEKFMNGEVI